eukprot:gene5696-11485_t
MLLVVCVSFICVAQSFVTPAIFCKKLQNYESNVLINAKRNWSPEDNTKADGENGIVYNVEMCKTPGINWGADLSFRWIYVLGVEPNGEAYDSGLVQKGDYIIGVNNITTMGQDFDFVLKTLSQQQGRSNYTFFRGAKEQLTGGPPTQDPSATTVSIRVVQDGKPDAIVKCPGGTNLRQALVGNGINVYRSLTRWTNCNGKQLCGTCIAEIVDGEENCSRKSINEENVLRENNPDSFRLTCVTSVYGDLTVKVQGPVAPSQWTR